MGVKAERRGQFLIELTVVGAIVITTWLTLNIGIEHMPNTLLRRETSRVTVANHRLSGPDYLDISSGLVDDMRTVNKFGRTTNADTDVATDIWDGANGTDDIDIWVAPTQARVHSIVSTSANDAAAGTGARTIRIYGLTSWSTSEVSEDVTLNGLTPVNTTNSYVIIHRMKFMTTGTGGTNAGVISATAATDSTLTAQINVGEGQTQMAIYGISSQENAYMVDYYASILRPQAATNALVSLLVNPIPDQESAAFQIKHTNGLETTGNSYIQQNFAVPFTISGPAIIKLQTTTAANNSDVSGGFDLVLKEA